MFEKTKAFFKDVAAEMKKVSYPKKDELIGSTWVVVITVFVTSFFLGIVDKALAELVASLLRQ